MKITMYELLGLIKDDKAPKKIRYNGLEPEYDKNTKDYYPYYGESLFEYKFEDCIDFLDDEVEIIEESNTIEKIIIKDNTLSFPNGGGQWTARNMDKAFAIKINKLIDEINNLKEND